MIKRLINQLVGITGVLAFNTVKCLWPWSSINPSQSLIDYRSIYSYNGTFWGEYLNLLYICIYFSQINFCSLIFVFSLHLFCNIFWRHVLPLYISLTTRLLAFLWREIYCYRMARYPIILASVHTLYIYRIL